MTLDAAILDAAVRTADHALHRAWTAAVGTPGYQKSHWLELANALWSCQTIEAVNAFVVRHNLENR